MNLVIQMDLEFDNNLLSSSMSFLSYLRSVDASCDTTTYEYEE